MENKNNKFELSTRDIIVGLISVGSASLTYSVVELIIEYNYSDKVMVGILFWILATILYIYNTY